MVVSGLTLRPLALLLLPLLGMAGAGFPEARAESVPGATDRKGAGTATVTGVATSPDSLSVRYSRLREEHIRSQKQSVDPGRLESDLRDLATDLEMAGQDSLALNTLGMLADFLAQKGNTRAGLAVSERGLELARKTGRRVEEANFLLIMGVAYGLEGKLEKTLTAMRDLLPIYEDLGDLRMQAICWGNVAYCYLLLGRVPESAAATDRRLPLARELGDSFILSSALSTLSQLKRLMGRPAEALVDADSSIVAARRENWALALGTGYLARAEALHDLGRFEEALSALEAAVAARKLGNNLIYLPQVLLAKAQVLLEMESYEESLGLLDELRPQLEDLGDPLLLLGSAALAGQALLELGRLREAEHGLEEAVRNFEATRELLQDPGSQAGIFVRGGEAFAALGRCRLQRGAVAEAWAAVERGHGRALKDSASRVANPIDILPALQDSLRAHRAVLLQYSDALLNPMVAFVISADSVAARTLGAAGGVAAQARLARDLMSSGAEDELVEPSLERLGRELLNEIVPLIPKGTQRIFVVAPAFLAALPFEALPQPQSSAAGATLGDDFAVSYLPSATFLLEAGRQATSPGSFVGFGDPQGTVDETGPENLPSQIRDLRSTPLPRAREELAAIAPRGATLYVGAEARMDRATSDTARGADVLHFATHAMVTHLVPEQSCLILSDGELTAAAIDSLRMEADMVTLSGCRTSSGYVYRGEGTAGLPQAFLSAGASSVVASRWDVEDGAAARFMAVFYEGLAAGNARDESLARAARTLAAEGYSSRDWAAFQIWGVGHRPVASLAGAGPFRPGSGVRLLAWGVAGVLALTTLVLSRRRRHRRS